MRRPIDTELHKDPMAAAVVLHWLAEGHASARNLGEGIVIPWAILGIGLIATETTRRMLPLRKQSFVGWVRNEGARHWRGYSKQTVGAWTSTFWMAVAHGQATGILDIQKGRVIATGKVTTPSTTSHAGLIRRTARALGGTLGGEQDDLRIASTLGLEFVV